MNSMVNALKELMNDPPLFVGATREAVYTALMEVRTDMNARGPEIAMRDPIDCERFYGVPVVTDTTLPAGELHIRYKDSIGKPHTAAVINVAHDLEAYRCAQSIKLLGPQTPADMLADYEQRKALDEEMRRESRKMFERGEITEEELYEGNYMFPIGLYPLVYESEGRVRGRKIGAHIPLTVKALEHADDKLLSFARERARSLIQEQAVKYLESLTTKCFLCGGDSDRVCVCHNREGSPCDMVCNPAE